VCHGSTASRWTASRRSDRSNQQLYDPRSCRAVWRHPADFHWIGRGSRCEWPSIELELDRRDVGAGAGKVLPADCGFSAHPQRDLTSHDSSVGMGTPRYDIQLIDVSVRRVRTSIVSFRPMRLLTPHDKWGRALWRAWPFND
jgi:hypothetical protein